MGSKHFLSKKQVHFSWQHVWVIFLIIFLLFGIGFVGLVAYANSFTNRVLPGVHLGDMLVGGMEQASLQNFLDGMEKKLINQGITFEYTDATTSKQFVLYPSIVMNDTVVDWLSDDTSKEAAYLVHFQKGNTIFSEAMTAIRTTINKPHTSLQYLSLDKKQLVLALHEQLKGYEHPVRNASITITHFTSSSDMSYVFVTSSSGLNFNYNDVNGQIISAWSHLLFPTVTIHEVTSSPNIVVSDIKQILPRLHDIFATGPITITYINPKTQLKKHWTITQQDMAKWIEVRRMASGALVFGLNKQATTKFLLKTISPNVDSKVQNAKFQIGKDKKRVIQFQGSHSGVSVNVSSTYAKINIAFEQRTLTDATTTPPISVQIDVKEPTIKTADVNNLGIKQILGVGYSNFHGSPYNRVKNIKHAVVDKLNGLLIKPGEVFSAIDALRPFTMKDGYVPELVIVGNRVKPEIAGGLCQIGTTLFRTAMNSGLPIVERTNHSLVVPYYNDPRNGNPGTDATLYDPQPDFKFKNNTGHYMLLEAKMNTTTGALYFTLWGTSDGRKGSYTVPVVEKWMPAGLVRYVETTTFPPGTRHCQEKANGAIAHFTYNIKKADGLTTSRLFRSYYHPLPEICFEGVTAQQLTSALAAPSSTPATDLGPADKFVNVTSLPLK